jgi:hypothetical protein
VIRLATPLAHLRPAERYGLSVLLDASRLLPVDDTGAGVVQLLLTDDRQVDYDSFVAGRCPFPVSDGQVRCSRSALTYVCDVAGAGEEQRADGYDRHDRVPSHQNPLVRAERWREPVISRHAAALRAAAVQAAGTRPVRCLAPWPEGRRWAAAFTHDLDVVAGWPAFTLLRILELLRHGEMRRVGRAALAALGAVGRAPVWRAVRHILDLEAAAGIRSTWFVLCGKPTLGTWVAGDVTYHPESAPARRIIAALREQRHEIGLHGSFATGRETSPAAFRTERDRLAALAGAGGAPSVPGVRQHFLRMRPGPTQRAMAEAGFRYDATFGYPDRNGFRLGVADIVPAWDALAQASPPLDEVPLVWMDRAQSKYAGVEDPDAWVNDALTLATTSREVEGLWVGLWHPNLTAALGYPDAPAAYERLTREVLAANPPPFVAPLGELVAWRAARRQARARTVAPDGRVDLVRGPEGSPWPVRLEDGAGRLLRD